jgi:hypothetical protein
MADDIVEKLSGTTKVLVSALTVACGTKTKDAMNKATSNKAKFLLILLIVSI